MVPIQMWYNITSRGVGHGTAPTGVSYINENRYKSSEQITLTRRIISFRKVREHYRRFDEVHYLRLYEATTVESELQHVGFGVETTSSYGKYLLSKGHVAFIARKPCE